MVNRRNLKIKSSEQGKIKSIIELVFIFPYPSLYESRRGSDVSFDRLNKIKQNIR